MFELFFPIILIVRNWKLKLFMLAGATVFHLANWLLMNVQFFTQLLPSSTHPIRTQLRQLVYQALDC